jgi:hypothetical protein
MTLPLGFAAIAFGAILTWGVNAHPKGVDVTAVGVILMVVGLVGVGLSLLLRDRLASGRAHSAVSEDHDVVVRQGAGGRPRPRRRTTVVEDEISGPPGPP